MKTLLSIILCSLSSILFIRAQSYVPFPEQNAVWVDHDTWLDPYHKGYDYCVDVIFETGGDTILNGTRYIKLYRTSVEFDYDFDIGCTYEANYDKHKRLYGFLRNDTTHKKVYFWMSYPNTNEKLIYDFDLKVNDTIDQNLIYSSEKTWVDSIATQPFGNYSRKVFYLKSRGMIMKMIEGVGYTSGFLRPGSFVNEKKHLACMQVNNVSIFSQYNGCQNTTSVQEKVEEEKFVNVYPNPVSDQFKVEITQGSKINEIELFDLTGKSVRIYNSNQLEFSVKGITPGVYILRIEETNKLYTKKLIVQ